MKQSLKEQLEIQQLASEYLDESLNHIYDGNLKVALDMAFRAKELSASIDDKSNLAMALNRISIIYDEMGNDALDLDYLLDALELVVDTDDYGMLCKLYNNLGSKYMYLNAYNRALNCFLVANDYFIKVQEIDHGFYERSHSFTMILNLNFSTTYYHLGNVKKAEEHYLLAKIESDKNLEDDLGFIFKCFEGLMLWRLGRKDEVYSLLDSIIESSIETEYTADYLEVMSSLLELLSEMKSFDYWEKTLSLMESRLIENAGDYVRLEVYRHWIEFYKASNNGEKYYETCIKYYELSKEKVAEDYAKSSDILESKIEMRRINKQNKNADEKVYRDTLTGIGNRNKMLEDSTKYIERSVQEFKRIAIGLIDIDYFKECNDTYGHIEGDNCLKIVASIIEKSVENLGNVYRYGGDEFLVILYDVEECTINNIGASIKAELAKANIPNEKSAISNCVTVSQGYTMAHAEAGDSIDDLIELADKVLYSVKRRGRDNYKFDVFF